MYNRIQIARTPFYRILAEVSLGRDLLPGEVVHHVDEDTFNDALDNLIVMTNEEHSRLHGINQSEEKKKQISTTLKGHFVSEETKRKISFANSQKKRTEETKLNLSKALVGNKNAEGHTISEEGRKAISKANLGNKHTLGKKVSEETKTKIRESLAKSRLEKNIEIIEKLGITGRKDG